MISEATVGGQGTLSAYQERNLVEGGGGARASGKYRCQSKLCCPKFQNRTGICPMCGRPGVAR